MHTPTHSLTHAHVFHTGQELILGFGVVRKALKKVRASNRGVLDVAKCIPLKCRIAMLTRYQRINEEMEEMASEGLYVTAEQ